MLYYNDENNKRIILMPETIDLYSGDIREEILKIINENKKDITFDMGNTKFLDSVGISIIMTCYSVLKREERIFKIRNIRGKVRNILNMSRIIELIGEE